MYCMYEKLFMCICVWSVCYTSHCRSKHEPQSPGTCSHSHPTPLEHYTHTHSKCSVLTHKHTHTHTHSNNINTQEAKHATPIHPQYFTTAQPPTQHHHSITCSLTHTLTYPVHISRSLMSSPAQPVGSSNPSPGALALPFRWKTTCRRAARTLSH